MNNSEGNRMCTCIQCGKKFDAWEFEEDIEGEIYTYTEKDICSYECDKEWRLDNREELCN